MRIHKPIRHILYPIPGALIAIYMMKSYPEWGNYRYLFILFMFPPLSLLTSLPIDSLDFWLRRKTKDSFWLMSSEGQAWLKSEEGQDWAKENNYKRKA